MAITKFHSLAVSSPSFCANPQLIQEASRLAHHLVLNSKVNKWTETELIDWLNSNRADALILGTEPFSEAVIDKLKTIKAVGKYGVGCDNVDIKALEERGIFLAGRVA